MDIIIYTPEEFRESDKFPIIVVLENIRSAYNVGSVFRTADAFLIEAIYIIGYSAKPPHKEIKKTALGAEETVNWKYFKTTAVFLLLQRLFLILQDNPYSLIPFLCLQLQL